MHNLKSSGLLLRLSGAGTRLPCSFDFPRSATPQLSKVWFRLGSAAAAVPIVDSILQRPLPTIPFSPIFPPNISPGRLDGALGIALKPRWRVVPGERVSARREDEPPAPSSSSHIIPWRAVAAFSLDGRVSTGKMGTFLLLPVSSVHHCRLRPCAFGAGGAGPWAVAVAVFAFWPPFSMPFLSVGMVVNCDREGNPPRNFRCYLRTANQRAVPPSISPAGNCRWVSSLEAAGVGVVLMLCCIPFTARDSKSPFAPWKYPKSLLSLAP